MSTSCLIGVKVGGKVEHIYCHWDGFPEGKCSVGQILKEHYLDKEKILKLMDLGDLSALGEEPIEDLEAWEDNVHFDHSKCLAYRTRGDKNVDKHTSKSEKDYIDYACRASTDFVYLFKDGEWWLLSGNYALTFKKF